MKLSYFAVAIFAVSALSGCATPPATTQAVQPTVPVEKIEPHVFKPIEFKYDSKSPEAMNFSRQLDLAAWQCGLEASSGFQMRRIGARQRAQEYGDSFLTCIKHARSEGDQAVARLKTAKPPAKQAELSKDLYTKWNAYLLTMSTFSTADTQAQSAYEISRQALSTEIKFSD